MDAQAVLSVSFHNMEVADDDEAAQGCERRCPEQQTGEDIPSDSEIQQRFMELWYQKGELLLYKAFVSRFPNCAVFYDQICGSIPPEVEVEIVTSEIFDSHADTSNREHLLDEAYNKEHCSSENQEHLYSNANNKEHNYNCASSREHLYSSKEPADSNWEKSLHKHSANKEYIDSEFDNIESRFDESIGKEHICSGISNKEHFYSIQNNKEKFNSGKKEDVKFDHCSGRLQQSESDKEILCEGLKVEKTLHGNCTIQQGMQHDTNVEGKVHEATNMERQLYSNSNECINNDSESKEIVCNDTSSKVDSRNDIGSVHEVTNIEKQLHSDECINNDRESKDDVCNDASNISHSELDHNGSRPAELPAGGEIILKHGTIFEAEGSMAEARNCSILNGSCSDSGLSFDGDLSSVDDVSSVAGSILQAALDDGSISKRHSDLENGLVVQLLPHEDNCYTVQSFGDHSYTNRTDVSYLSADCEDCLAVDGQDDAEQFGHGELIARLQEAHEDLKNQIFAHVREIFAEWMRRNPEGEFDVSSLDRDLMAVANPFMEVEFADEQ